jgi:predicted alpha/beta hydrolase family esterase
MQVERVFIVHGWGSNPERNWFPRIKNELERAGFEVHVPRMPSPYLPDRKGWVKTLATAVGTPDQNTHFIGHSLGCTTILLYLQSTKTKVGNVIFVAPWIDLKRKSLLARILFRTWRTTRILFSEVRNNINHITTILADKDPYIPVSIERVCKKHFGHHVIVIKGDHHFAQMEKLNVPKVLMNEIKNLQQHMERRKIA